MAKPFDDDERAAVYRAIYERRDMRHFVRAPVDPAVLDRLIAAMQPLTPGGTEDRVYLRGDTAANYGAVMKVMGVLSKAGYAHIGLITDQAQGQGQ